MPIGSLLGGALAEIIGIRPMLAVGATWMLLASAWVVLSPLARERH